MDFGTLKKGDAFKLSDKGRLTYTKQNATDAKCNTRAFSIGLGKDHKVYPTQHGP